MRRATLKYITRAAGHQVWRHAPDRVSHRHPLHFSLYSAGVQRDRSRRLAPTRLRFPRNYVVVAVALV